MSKYLRKLSSLFELARKHDLIDQATSDKLLDLAALQDQKSGMLSLAGTLSMLGGTAALVGMILLLAANWSGIPDWTKILGLLALLAGMHAAAMWIRLTNRPYCKTAETLHLMGAGLFLAGIGLIAQIYHLNARPPNGVLLWFVAIAPLAYLLRSGAITIMSVFALLIWAHLEGTFPGSALYIREGLVSHLVVDLGIGMALVGLSARMRHGEPVLAKALRTSGAFILFVVLYLLGFYRYFSNVGHRGSLLMPCVAMVLAVMSLAAGWRHLAPESIWLRNRLLILLVCMMSVGGLMLMVDAGMLPQGADLDFFQFGGHAHFRLAEWMLTCLAWVLWFLLALWCVMFGARANRKAYLNAGTTGVGLGIITRFFDLMGSMAETGTLFLAGGMVLVGTGWAVEKWRRSLLGKLAGMEA